MGVSISGSGVAIAVAVFLGALVGRVWCWRVPGLPFAQGARSALFLTRYATALEYYGLRRREVRAHVDELRAGLVALDPSEVGPALRRFGHPRSLAAEVAGDDLRPSVLRGVLWLGTSALVTLAVQILTVEAFLGGFEIHAHPGEVGRWSFAGLSVKATMGGGGHASAFEFGGPWLLAVPLAAFLVGARSWRVLRRSSRRRAAT